MLLDTAPCTDLPGPLLDSITEHLTGLRQVALRRGQGRKGDVSTGTSWTLTGETSGEPTGHDEVPDIEAEDIAREVVNAAIEVLSSGDGKERRFEAVLRVVTETNETQKHSVGFELEEDAALKAPRGRLSMESELAGLVQVLSTSLQAAHRDLHRSNASLNANVREVGKAFREALKFRMDGFEDHFHAALYGAGARPKPGDDSWKKDGMETANKLIDLATAAATGGNSDDKPKGGKPEKGAELRDALAKFGGTISSAQQGELIKSVGVGTIQLLLKAGKADTDIAAAKLVYEFLGKLEGHGEKVTEILTEEQNNELRSVLEIYQPMVEVVERG